jgi:hypothetical protein
MNPVEEGAVAGDVGAEPAGAHKDHGQLNPAGCSRCWPAIGAPTCSAANRGVCRSGVHHAWARARAEPARRRRNPRPAGPRNARRRPSFRPWSDPGSDDGGAVLEPPPAAPRDALPTITSTNRRQLAEQFAEALLPSGPGTVSGSTNRKCVHDERTQLSGTILRVRFVPVTGAERRRPRLMVRSMNR